MSTNYGRSGNMLIGRQLCRLNMRYLNIFHMRVARNDVSMGARKLYIVIGVKNINKNPV